MSPDYQWLMRIQNGRYLHYIIWKTNSATGHEQGNIPFHSNSQPPALSVICPPPCWIHSVLKSTPCHNIKVEDWRLFEPSAPLKFVLMNFSSPILLLFKISAGLCVSHSSTRIHFPFTSTFIIPPTTSKLLKAWQRGLQGCVVAYFLHRGSMFSISGIN